MTPRAFTPSPFAVLIVVLLAVMLFGCGYAGPLAPPPLASAPEGNVDTPAGNDTASLGFSVQAPVGPELADIGRGPDEPPELVDEVGGMDSPVDVALPFSGAFGIGPGDEDCFRFRTELNGTMSFVTSDGDGGCSGGTTLALFKDESTEVLARGGPTPDAPCASLATTQDAGTYVLCVAAPSVDATVPNVVLTLSHRPRLTLTEVSDAGGARYLELFNPTDVSSTFHGLRIEIIDGGAPFATSVITVPSTVLAPGQLFVIATDAAAFEQRFGRLPDYADAALVFDGDEAIALTHDGERFEVFGKIGEPATAAWAFAGISAIRNDDVTGPTAEPDDSEWTLADQFDPWTR